MKLRSGKRKRSGENDEYIDLNDYGKTSPSRESGTRNAQKNAHSLRDKQRNSDGVSKNREYAVITYIFLAVFLILIVYMVYFMNTKSTTYMSSAYNSSRIDALSENVVRGSILSSDGTVLAYTDVDEDGDETRVYPYSEIFAHVVGFDTNGKSGIESAYDFNLLVSHEFFITQIVNDLKNEKNAGDNLVTTLNVDMQKLAYEALGSYDGAVIAMEPDTGRIICMVSKPDFDPNTIASVWDSLSGESSVLVNRVTQGLYPPGSVFKIFTTLEYYRENRTSWEDYSYNCTSEITMGDTTIHCYGNSVHGQQDITESFAHSCNTSFANIGLSLNISRFSDLCEKLMFNKSLDFILPTSKSGFTLDKSASDGLIMQTAIGQGDTLVTPLHMALIASAIANDGVLMEPYLVDSIQNASGATITTYSPKKKKSLLSKKQVKLLKNLMRAVVTDGTATSLNSSSYTAYGKTGTAEFNSAKDSHAWFVGFAENSDGEELAIAVIVEDSGAGSTYAVPIAKKLFDEYL